MNFAKTTSDVIAKMRASFDEEVKAKRETRRKLELSKKFLRLTLARAKAAQDQEEDH